MPLLDSLRIAPDIPEEIGEELETDPEPSEKPTRPAKRTRAPKRVAPAPRPTVAKLSRQVAEDLASLIEGGAAVWGLQDDCCAPVLEQQARPIADAFTAILARNPRLLEKFANADVAVYTMQSAALFRALAPVGKAVYRNHIAKAPEGDPHDGLDQFPVYQPRI